MHTYVADVDVTIWAQVWVRGSVRPDIALRDSGASHCTGNAAQDGYSEGNVLIIAQHLFRKE